MQPRFLLTALAVLLTGLVPPAFAQTASVALKDGSNTVVSTHSSVNAAYAAIPATLTQPYIIEIGSTYTGANETFPITMTAKAGAGAANTITIRPAAGVTAVTILGTVGSNSALFKLDDADWIIFDGRPGGTGTTRALTLDAQGTSSTGYGIWLINGATHNVFRWCNFNGWGSGSSGNKFFYINTSASNPSGNSDNDFLFNIFTGARTAINSSGTDANNNNNLYLFGNTFLNTKFAGFWGQGGNGRTVLDSNYFYSNAPSGTSGTGAFGILVDFLGDTMIITRNRIFDFDNSTNTTDVFGISIRSADPYPNYTYIANNFIALNAPNPNVDEVHGITFGFVSANNPIVVDVLYNTVLVGGTAVGGTAGNVGSSAFFLDATNTGSTYNVKNNIFINARAGGSEQHIGMYTVTANGTHNRDYNTYNVTSGNIARIGTTVHTALATYQAAVTPNEAAANTAPVLTVSSTDLHLAGTSIGNTALYGANIGNVTTDIDGDPRLAPYRGADEAVATPTFCTGTPVARTLSAPASVCSGSPVTLSFSGQTAGTGVYYMLQSRPAGSTGAWTTLSSATTPGSSASQTLTQDTEFRLHDSCSNSGLTANSNSVTVTVTPLPNAGPVTASGPLTFCAGGSVVLNAGLTAGYSYQWQLNNNNIPGAAAATYTAAAAGSYTVVVTSSGCSATSGATVVTVNPAPPAAISAGGPVNFCTGGSVVLSANTGSGLTYQWQLNGSNIPGATGATYTATAAGNYTVVVTGSGCSATSPATAVAVTTPPPAAVTTSGPLTFCAGGNVVLTANAGTGYTYQWQLNGTNIAGATGGSYTANASGSYTVIVANGGCSATSVASVVTVNPAPSAAITAAGPLSFCQGGNVVLNANTGSGLSYQWQLNGNNIAGATAAAYTAAAAGSYTVVVTASGCAATSAATTVNVSTMPAATVTAMGPLSFCPGGTVTLQAGTGTGYTYQWQLNGTNIAGATGASYTASGTGSYTVIVTNGSCNATSAATAITVFPLPAAAITPAGPVSFCQGDSIVLQASAGAGLSYQWLLNGTGITTATAASHTAKTPGFYTVTVTDGNSCSATSPSVAVTVHPLPVPVITSPAPGLLSTGTFTSYQWNLNGQPVNGATAATYTAPQNGTYSVTVTDANGCTGTSLEYNLSTVGIAAVGSPGGIRVYPNPANGIVYLAPKAAVGEVLIFSAEGHCVLRTGSTGEVDLSTLADGLYLMKVIDNKGATHLLKLTKAGR